MSEFHDLGFEIVPNLISEETAKILSIEFEILRDNYFYSNAIPKENIFASNDRQVQNSFSWYGAYCFESLLSYALPTIENITNRKLYPTYSYARIYYNGATMPIHKDRPSCQYSATVTISVDDTGPWEIWMMDKNDGSHPLKLSVGDMCVYRGDLLSHWRSDYKGTKQIQAFLHYVDADGEYASNKFDKRKMLGAARNIASFEDWFPK